MCRSHIGPLPPQEDTASQRGREGLAWEMQERKGGGTDAGEPAPRPDSDGAADQ